jgi:hypothetical protein
MRRRIGTITAAATLLVALSSAAAAPPPPGDGDDDPGFTPIFNGKDLEGWSGKPGWWRVEDGAITAESTPEKPCLKHNYLIWTGGQPGDFELRLDYRLIGPGGNSGIQFRSETRPDWDTHGYQADIEGGDQWTGCLFEHARGGVAMRGERVRIAPDGTRTVEPLGDPAALLKAVRKEDWNTYRITAAGDTITLAINDVIMCQAIDNQDGHAARSGIIAFQMHPGPPMKVQFRDIRLKELAPKKTPAATSR